MLTRFPPRAPSARRVLEDGAADTGVAVLRQQRDVDDPDLPLPAGEIEASDGLAVPEDDQKIAAPVVLLVSLVLRVELGARKRVVLGLDPIDNRQLLGAGLGIDRVEKLGVLGRDGPEGDVRSAHSRRAWSRSPD